MAAAMSRRKEQPAPQASPSRRSVVLCVAVRLDGSIARPEGSANWRMMDPEMDLGAYAKVFDVMVAGRKTLPPKKASGNATSSGAMGMGQVACYVFSRTVPPVTRESLKEELIDRMDLGIMPVLLGQGIPLFPQGFLQRNFTLAKFQAYKSGVIMA